MTDKNLVRKRFEGGFEKYDRLASVQKEISDELAGFLKEYMEDRIIKTGLEVGVGTGFLTSHLVSMLPECYWYLNDLTPFSEEFIKDKFPGLDAGFLWGDAETKDLPVGLDLIASSSVIQWFSDKEKFFKKCRSSLSEKGIFAFSTYGDNNFREVRAAAGYGLDYNTKDEISAMLGEAGFRIIYAEEKTKKLFFDIPIDVLYYMKTIGVNSVNVKKRQWTRRQVEEFSRKYKELFSDKHGLLPLTYHPLYFIAQKI